jgi:hypothetical protein
MLDQFAGGGFSVMPYDMKVVSAGEGWRVTYDGLRVPAAEDQGLLLSISISARFR